MSSVAYNLRIIIIFLALAAPPLASLKAEEGGTSSLLLQERGQRKAGALFHFAEALRESEYGRRLDAKSVKAFVEAVRLDPDSGEALMFLRSYWFPRRMYGQCVNELLPTAEANPGIDELVLMVVEALIQQGELARAASLLERSLIAQARTPRETEKFVILLGSLYGRMEDYEKGERLFDSCLANESFSEDLSIRVAALVFFSLKANKDVDSIFPSFIADWSKRRFRRKMEDNFAVIEKIFQEKRPTLNEVAPVLEVCRQFKMWDRFEHILLNSLASNPSDVVIRNLLGMLYFEKKDYAEAARVWKSLSEENPNEARYYLETGKSLFFGEKFPAAAKTFERFLIISPDDPAALFLLGVAYLEIKNYHKAIYKLSRIPENPKAHYYIAICHTRLKEYDRALSALNKGEEAAKKRRDDTEETLDKSFYLLYAEIYEKTGKFDQGVKVLQDLYARMPGDDTVANFLGYVWADHGVNLDEAEKLISIALEKQPDSSAYLDSMAWVLFKKKDFKGAERYIMKAIEYSKEEPDAVILDHAGDIQMGLLQTDTALSFWKMALLGDSEELDKAKVVDKIRSIDKTFVTPIGKAIK